MLYVQLNTNWVLNPKVARAGIDGAGLHATCLCLSKMDTDSDGWIDLFMLARFGSTDELVDRLVGLRLLDREGDRVRPHGWTERNMTAAEIAAKKTDNAKKANHAKWNHAAPYSECERCHPPEDSVADPGGVQADPPVSLESESEEESEPSPTTDLDRIVDAVFDRVLRDKQQRGETIFSVEGLRSWWDEHEREGCRKRAAWFLEHYDMPTIGHYADATRSPSVPRWAVLRERKEPA